MNRVSLRKIFSEFAYIGSFTIGGGYMMVPAIEARLRKRGWISDDELSDMVALSQSAPGLLTVNMAIFAGYRLRGIPGSVVATLGCIIAPFLIILAIAMFFSAFSEAPVIQAIFRGVRPVAVAIIAAYAVKLLRRHTRWWEWVITLVAFAAIAFLEISPIYILLTIIVIAAAVMKFREGRPSGKC